MRVIMRGSTTWPLFTNAVYADTRSSGYTTDAPMALDGTLAREVSRADSHLKMPSAVARSLVARMAATVVDDLELVWSERRLEPAANERDAFGCHGRTCSTGLISTSANTPSVT